MAGLPATLRRLTERHLAWLAGAGLLFTFFRWSGFTGWDDAFYICQLTSTVADRDLVLQNDILRMANPLYKKLQMLTWITDTGAIRNTFSIGPAVAHASYAWPLLVGRERPVSFALRATLAVGSMGFLVLMVLATLEMIERMGFSARLARVAAVLAIASGPLATFGTRVLFNAHLPSGLFAALFCLAVLLWLESAAARHALLAGLTAGLLVITRWQEAILVASLLPAAAVAFGTDRPRRRARTLGLCAASVAFAAVVAIQLVAWRVQFGTALLVPQGSDYMHWAHPALVPFLLSTYHGLVPWTPGLALGLVGLAFIRPEGSARRLFVWGLVAAVVVSIYVSACPKDWWGGASYGPRRLAALTPIAALGLARVLKALGSPVVRWAAVTVLAAWAVFVWTAFWSGFDDLSVVFTHSTSRFHPASIAAYTQVHWIDHGLTWPRVLRPGFTFTDAPHNADRILGLATTLAVTGLLLTVWRWISRSIVLQRAVVGLAAAWCALALTWSLRLPSNVPLNPLWGDVVRGGSSCARVDVSAIGLDGPIHLICAVRAIESGEPSIAEVHLSALKRAGESGIDAASLSNALVRARMPDP
jgi:hypothetical protein